MLDELAGGLTPTEMDEVMDVVRRVRESGITVIVIEHNMGGHHEHLRENYGLKLREKNS